MNAADFDTQFDRLTGHFHLPTDAKRDTLALDWYQAVQGYDADVVERSVTTLIRAANDRYWPPMGKLLELCRGRVSGVDRGGKCATCHGSGWIDSAPFLSNGMVYGNACLRCPDCGIPAPQYSAPNNRAGLTASEYREWTQRETQPNYMPQGLEARPRPDGEVSEIKAAMDRLRVKLFGHKPVEREGETA